MNKQKAWIRQLLRLLSRLQALPGVVTTRFQIEPPIPDDEIERIQSGLTIKIPAPVREFLAHASGGVTYHYDYRAAGERAKVLTRILGVNAVLGLGEICSIERFAKYQEYSQEWARNYDN